MIKRIKKFIRGGDAATVERAIEMLATGNGHGSSCLTLAHAGGKPRFVRLYRKHSDAYVYSMGFRGTSDRDWGRMGIEGRTRVRIARLTAFKESLE